ncbi:Bug family tripartite tricarboxylate transporter substrate binding protein [Shinella sp.]|uniref:Bug family tripartite tricarboxylate transporter substrate binding protein n=1 Tax=Shinella sp. TaxID=1870904 RepID=UPI003F6F0C29
MMKYSKTRRMLLAGAIAFLATAPHQALAQTVEEFYKGKTIDMVIGYAPGGSNDAYARAVANHIGKHIPGNPQVIPLNMPGGGSLLAANHLANIAPKDGSVLGVVASTIPLDEQLGSENIQFKSADFNWIGRVASNTNVTFVNASTNVKTVQDAMNTETILAATGASSTVAIYPSVMNTMAGTKFKLVMGYEGSAEAMLAMERGEVDGHSTSLAAVMTSHPEWMTSGKVNFLVQYGLTRHAELPNVPTAIELIKDPAELAATRLILGGVEVGKPVLTTPGVPADRVEALRRAFDAMLKDPDFVNELTQQRLEISPMSGEELQKVVSEAASATPELIARVKAVWPNQ